MTTILETERLRFRRLIPDDLNALYALYRDPEMRQYYPEGILDYAQTKEELEWFLHGHPKQPELGLWATIYKETNVFIGRCGLLPWTLEGRAEVEVAYMVDKHYWRQGLGTEAAQGIRDYAFETLRLTRLICMVDPNNAASAKVATNIGMTLEKEAVDEFGPFLLFSMDKPAG